MFTRWTNISFFDLGFRILLILLPFTTILSVFTSQILHIPGVSFYKEILIGLGLVYISYMRHRGILQIHFTLIDKLICAYIAIMVIVSLGTTGIKGIVYGGRYDFEFLLAFWVIYHGAVFLREKTSYYLKLFLYSSGLMLLLSGLLKWPLSEDLLLYAGYCGNPSAWAACNGVPPIFHGIDGANVRRFQGLLDSPNTMGAFLLLFSGIFAYYTRAKKDWYFVIGGAFIILIMMVLYTYSRSALLGMIAGVGVVLIGSLRFLYRRYRTQVISLIVIASILVSALLVSYAGSWQAIIGRAGSTKGHFERMTTSIERWMAYPMGQGLASSGPAYRYIYDFGEKNRESIEKADAIYIPESWYIQQFVEGGWIGGLLFIAIMIVILVGLMQIHIILGGMYLAILVMNMFLHTFEASVLVLPLFLLIGLLLSPRSDDHIQ